MIRHIVTWKLAADTVEDRSAAVAAIGAALLPLVDIVDGLDWLEVHADVHETDVNWDVVLVSQFASRAALAAYQEHPEHVSAGAVVRALVTERATVDYELG